MRRLLLVTAAGILAGVAVVSPSPAATCTSAQQTARSAALTAYENAMPSAKARFFRTHRSAAARATFVKAQRAKLAALKSAAACSVGGTLPSPLPAPAPTANEHFTFEDGVSNDVRQMVQDDVAWAVADEQTLVGASYGEVNVFVGATPAWLAQQDCGFHGYVDPCQAQKTQQFTGGGGAEGGWQALFMMVPPAGQSATETQKVIAHELFHVFQYETASLPNDQTSSSGVRPLGPAWLHEGLPEMLGYRALGDRHLGYTTYAALLATEKGKAKAPAPPLEQLLTVDQDRAAGSPYALYMVAADHLAAVGGGLPAIAAYYRDIAAGQTWPAAFQSAFGMTVDAFYASFAAYRAAGF